MTLNHFIQEIPKSELHIHVEGALYADMAFQLAKKNGISLPYKTEEELQKAYHFSNLQEFLDLYHLVSKVVVHEEDFYALTYDYFERLASQNVKHVEFFFDSQSHTQRGIKFETVVDGIYGAMKDAEEHLGISSYLILCFLRHLSEEEGMVALDKAIEHKDKIKGIGLASSELGHPPSKFIRAFDKARSEGFEIVAHAGEEGPPEYIWQAIDLLKVQRIDHGNAAIKDYELMGLLAHRKIPLTMCPVSNLELCVIDDLKEHPLKKMMEAGLNVTVNSDDPAYFKGTLNENFIRIAEALSLDKEDIYHLCRNAFEASFLPDDVKQKHLKELSQFYFNNA